jgi:hypothetical protein
MKFKLNLKYISNNKDNLLKDENQATSTNTFFYADSILHFCWV